MQLRLSPFALLLLCCSHAALLTQATVIDTAKLRCSSGNARFAYNFADCTTYFMCAHGVAVLMRCPGDLVFSMRKERCVFRQDFHHSGCTTAPPPETPPPTAAMTTAAHIHPRCVGQTGHVSSPSLCHRYYDCDTSDTAPANPRLQLQERECPYPQLFDDVSKTCAPFHSVTCGSRQEVKNPCDYATNQCYGAHCMPCSMRWAKCSDPDLADGLHPWPSGKADLQWVRCQGGRNVDQGGCPPIGGIPAVFSAVSLTCRRYNETIHEQCSPSRQLFPHPAHCHRYYDCAGYNFTLGDPDESLDSYLRTCPYPDLFSTVSNRCRPYSEVDCGMRMEAVTPCEYKQGAECDDPMYGSCRGLGDGLNVYRTREGSPHFVVCTDQRTVEKKICGLDRNGLYRQFSPRTRSCMSVRP